jgi:hypothetical protein
MATPPAATPATPARTGPGCLVALVLLPIVIILGLVVGTVLSDRGDESADEASVTLDEGTIDGVEWRVDAVRDVEGESCAFLYQDGEQLTGACTSTPQDATIGAQTVVFGRAADGQPSVRVELDTGAVVEIDTVSADGVDGTFFVEVVDGDVDAEAFAP